MKMHHESKHGGACKRGLIKVMKVRGGWKWSLLPPGEVRISGGRSWSGSFDQWIKPFTEAEDDLIIKLHSLLGNRWALIAGRLPDRTENEVKTHWNSKLEAKLLKNSNMRTKKQKTSLNLTRALDQSQISDASSGLVEEDSGVTTGLNLNLSMSMSSSPLWNMKEKVEANSLDPSPNIDTGNTGNKTLLLFQ